MNQKSQSGRSDAQNKYEPIKKGIVKRSQRRVVGVFVDGISLDRATKRFNKRIDFQSLIKGVCGGLEPRVARYYTIIPFEDDSRQHSFLDAVYRGGFEVLLKRLPPKHIERQATTDIEMGVD